MKKVDIKKLTHSSINIFEDCLMPNGCLVAAPTHQPYYPKDAKSYLYSWPGRDVGFSLAAFLLVGIDYYEQVLSWLWERAEDFLESENKLFEGLIFKSYHTNGLIREHEFQPDQGGTLLWSIGFKKNIAKRSLSELELRVTKQLADSYVKVWDGRNFKLEIEDLWEERRITAKKGHFTYSLAACATGMEVAYNLLNNESYKRLANQMKELLLAKAYDEKNGQFKRAFGNGRITDVTSDGSELGLIWPFDIGFDEVKLVSIVDILEQKLVSDFGVHRYSQDVYKGADSHNHINDRAGAWPLLTFWMSIAYSQLGDKKKGEKYFQLVFDKVRYSRYIPEQLFCCSFVPWTGISPLLWSHTKAILAAWKLGKIKSQFACRTSDEFSHFSESLV